MQLVVERLEVDHGEAPSISDRVFAVESHVVHAAEHAAIRGLGDEQLIMFQLTEGAEGDPSARKYRVTSWTTSWWAEQSPRLECLARRS